MGTDPNDMSGSRRLVMDLPVLTLPEIEAVHHTEDGRQSIRCLIRRKFVALTPEEWVRQHMIHYLVEHRTYPASLITVEQGFRYQGMARRADVIAHDRAGRPLLLVECKAPAISIRQETFEQASRYNLVVGARYIAVSNGMEHFCFQVDHNARSYRFLDDIPPFELPT